MAKYASIRKYRVSGLPKRDFNITATEFQDVFQGNAMDLRFPGDLFRFVYLVFFKPFSLRAWIDRIDPPAGTLAGLLTHAHDRLVRPYQNLALFHILVTPWLLGIVTILLLGGLGMGVSWSGMVLFLIIAIALSSSFSVIFSIALLLPFSIAIAYWSSTPFELAPGVIFSLMLGLAYGLTGNGARWGLFAGLVYGIVFSLILDLPGGLAIGAAYLTGYFRILFYLLEAPLSWVLGTLASSRDALRLWRFHPARWDELVWFPLPRLDRHLLAIQKQDATAAPGILLQVKNSFRQGWAAQQVLPE